MKRIRTKITTSYYIEKHEGGYRVTDGLWVSAEYRTRAVATRVMSDACWGERGADDRGTYAHLRIHI